MKVEQKFVSVGVNRVVNSLDWGQHGQVAYGGHHSVVIYDPKAAEVTATMVGHAGMVNCVLWLPQTGTQGAGILASGAADNTIRIWAVYTSAAAIPWECLAVLQGHTAPITALAVQKLPDSGCMLVSTAGDSDMHVWICKPADSQAAGAAGADAGAGDPPGVAAFRHWHLDQKLHVGHHIKHAVALTHLPSDFDWLLLAAGGADNAVHLYVRAPGRQFEPACKLAGHENWIRSLSFCHVRDGSRQELLLASASQDRYGRIWTIQEDITRSAGNSDGSNPLANMIMRYAPKPFVHAGQRWFSVTLESLLIGHEDWVYSVTWEPVNQAQALHDRGSVTLLTASMDRTMLLWRYEANSGLWMNQASVGDAGASCLGYFGGVFSPDAQYIMAHGFTGALHLWQREAARQRAAWLPRHAAGGHFGTVADACWGVDGACLMSVSTDQTARLFTPVGDHWCEIARTQVHGHDFSCIAFIPFPSNTVSCTNTTSSIASNDGPTSPHADTSKLNTHKPLIINTAATSITALAAPDSAYMYVSGSEEKVLRVFEAPQAFLDTLDMAQGREAVGPVNDHPSAAHKRSSRAFGASVTALGLSQKAVYEGATEDTANNAASGGFVGDYTDGPDFVPSAAPSAVHGPPLEEHLAQNTLWPEIHKLYGHGNDVYCLAASSDGRYIASACVAKTVATATVWVWSTRSWQGVAQLQAHTLTVTQLAWSHSNDYLVACSRDRTFSLFKRTRAVDPSSEDAFSLLGRVKSAHSRVIWGVTWSCNDALIATGSRDETVKVWAVKDGTNSSSKGITESASASETAGSVAAASVHVPNQSALVLPAFPCAVTAVAFSSSSSGGGGGVVAGGCQYTLAIGLENGCLQLWTLHQDAHNAVSNPQCVWQTSDFNRHAAAINTICWRNVTSTDACGAQAEQQAEKQQQREEFATCADDHSVRVYSCIF